jgi:putative protease
MHNKTPIELLAPARNVDFGKTAINHGADAIYIGAPQFGARAAVGNSIKDIEELTKYAHLFRAKAYVALNTILFDNELEQARKLIHELYHAGIDGLIIQDMGLLEMELPPIPLIASTQTHNATPEKVLFLEKTGFQRVILARELSLEDISKIRQQTTVELECFVHGALCVSYSGQCYMSQAVCGRSGNRGVCAQPCRSAYDLVDSRGEIIVRNKHLLSTKDLNLSDRLESLLNAGITSFKIEGRLKDIDYLKNVVASYRKSIDALMENSPFFTKSSSGHTLFSFETDVEKSFNRGFTHYNIDGRVEKTSSFLTQKSLGKRIGEVSHVSKDWFIVTGEELNNADGICFFDEKEQLVGTLVGKVEGEKVYPNSMSGIKNGLILYRNHDHRFEKQLQGETAKRKINVSLILKDSDNGLRLEVTDEDATTAFAETEIQKTEAQKIELVKSQTITQLSKTGDTSYSVAQIDIQTSKIWFIPAGVLNQLRRDALNNLSEKRIQQNTPAPIYFEPNNVPYPEQTLTYTGNVLNQKAKAFYQRHGIQSIAPAFETYVEHQNEVVMTTKHCIRYQLDACPVHQKTGKRFSEPLVLRDLTHEYRLDFDCKRCVMKVIFIK